MSKLTGLERLIAEQEIRDLCYRYARGADRLDVELFKSVFTEDGAYRDVLGSEPISQTAGDLLGAWLGMTFSRTQHLNGNILIDFEDERNATTEIYFQAFHLTSPDLSSEAIIGLVGQRRFGEMSHADGNCYEIVVGGRYLDNVEQHDGLWKIRFRRLIFDYCTVRPSSTLLMDEGMMASGRAKSARNPTDPSYTR